MHHLEVIQNCSIEIETGESQEQEKEMRFAFPGLIDKKAGRYQLNKQ